MNDLNVGHAFILGCERSGSTWVANVLDSHRDTEFYMEPFADYAELFPGFPCRNYYMEHNSDNMANVLREGYYNLSRYKYLLFYRRDKSLYWKKIDNYIVKIYTYLARIQRFRTPVRVRQFELLNLNLAKVPIHRQVDKNAQPLLNITKELRLNFKIGFLHRVFPKAKFIVVVRHPGAQIASIIKLFQQGHLGELRRSLLSLFTYLRASTRFEKYSKYYDCMDRENDEREILLLWWLINYETVIEDCKRYCVDYKVVYNDDLSNAPEEAYKELFSFIGLDYSQDVRSYISHSTQGSCDSRGAAAISPVNTIRDSSKYSFESISNISDELKLGISNLYNHFEVCDELIRYRNNN